MNSNYESLLPTTDRAQLDNAIAAASAAAPLWSGTSAAGRANVLRAVADKLDEAAHELIPLAATETHLSRDRLVGELARTTYQLRFFAWVLEEGSFMEAIIDTADPHHPLGPRPDLRRMLLPLGPIAVYAASNFPFAFSVAGGDTAAALAAGCPVIVKAHPGHPRLSQRTEDIIVDALTAAGAPAGLCTVVYGIDTGIDLLKDERITAAAFTGSIQGGRILADVAAARPTPIPFYGELGSINPTLVTRAAIKARGQQIAEGFVQSFTLGVGQFCTKPGLLLLPTGHGLEPAIIDAARAVPSALMLNPSIADGYSKTLATIVRVPSVRTLLQGNIDHLGASPTVLATDAATVIAQPEQTMVECFGPAALVVDYKDLKELTALLAVLPASLTATIHAEPEDLETATTVLQQLTSLAGRIVWNGWPTGVAVSWAQHHGGPYPATIVAGHTSVGATSIRRFQRPICFQGMPQQVLPMPLQDINPTHIIRRINNHLTTNHNV